MTPGPEIRRRIFDLSEGNPGCISVLCAIVLEVGEDSAGPAFDAMEEIGLRGRAVWRVFKDFAGGNAGKFMLALMGRDHALLGMIEGACGETRP